MQSIEQLCTKLQKELVERLNHWYSHFWQPFIDGNRIVIPVNSLYDVQVVIKQGQAFSSKVLFLELFNPRDTKTNEQINLIVKDLYSQALPLALVDLSEEVYSSFREVCNRIIVQVYDNAEPVIVDLRDIDRIERFRVSNQMEPNSVFLVHGRDHKVKNELVQLLTEWKLKVFEWEDLIIDMKVAMPYVFDVVDYGLRRAHAMLVLFTPDDKVRLRNELVSPSNRAEGTFSYQPRPNVILEAGMALGKGREHTVVIQSAPIRDISDLSGMNNIRMNDPEWKYKLAKRLITVKCHLSIDVETLRAKTTTSGTKDKISEAFRFAPDPVNRRIRLIEILNEYGGPTKAGWIDDVTAIDYRIKKLAEDDDDHTPFKSGDRVFVQMHSKSIYNGKIGTITREWRSPHHYYVKFDDPNLLEDAFNVMYLSRIIE